MADKPWIHPFEAAGLGKAPFYAAGMHESVYQATPDAPKQPGATCDYCGQAIRYVFHVKSSDGQSFGVGEDCAEKTGDTKLSEANRKARKAFDKARSAQVRAKRVASLVETVEAREGAALRRLDEQASRRTWGASIAQDMARKLRAGLTETLSDRQKALLRQIEASDDEPEPEPESGAIETEPELGASRHVGVVGQRVTLTLTLDRRITFDSRFGVRSLVIMRDDNGNRFVWWTSSAPSLPGGKGVEWGKGGKWRTRVVEGEQFEATATIKAHSQYEGEDQTELTRLKVTKMLLWRDQVDGPGIGKKLDDVRFVPSVDMFLDENAAADREVLGQWRKADMESKKPSAPRKAASKRSSKAAKRLYLWKYNRVTGMWDQQRNVLPETADEWLTRFQRDEPDEAFLVSARRPTPKPSTPKKASKQKPSFALKHPSVQRCLGHREIRTRLDRLPAPFLAGHPDFIDAVLPRLTALAHANRDMTSQQITEVIEDALTNDEDWSEVVDMLVEAKLISASENDEDLYRFWCSDVGEPPTSGDLLEHATWALEASGADPLLAPSLVKSLREATADDVLYGKDFMPEDAYDDALQSWSNKTAADLTGKSQWTPDRFVLDDNLRKALVVFEVMPSGHYFPPASVKRTAASALKFVESRLEKLVKRAEPGTYTQALQGAVTHFGKVLAKQGGARGKSPTQRRGYCLTKFPEDMLGRRVPRHRDYLVAWTEHENRLKSGTLWDVRYRGRGDDAIARWWERADKTLAIVPIVASRYATFQRYAEQAILCYQSAGEATEVTEGKPEFVLSELLDDAMAGVSSAVVDYLGPQMSVSAGKAPPSPKRTAPKRPSPKRPSPRKPSAKKASAKHLKITDPGAFGKLAKLEGKIWERNQTAGGVKLDNSFALNRAAYDTMLEQGLGGLDVPLSELDAKAGVILGAEGTAYIVMPDGEIMLDGASANPSKRAKAFKLMQVIEDE